MRWEYFLYTMYSRNRQSIRLRDYDYSQPGYYFATVCTQDRDHLFGRVVGAGQCTCPLGSHEAHVELNHAGEMIRNQWREIGQHFNDIQIDIFIVMPNHVHGIFQIIERPTIDGRTHDANGRIHGSAPTAMPDALRRFKRKTTNEYIRGVRFGIYPAFDRRIWQRNYYDRVIRDERDLERIREYIRQNPAKWDTDELNTKNRS